MANARIWSLSGLVTLATAGLASSADAQLPPAQPQPYSPAPAPGQPGAPYGQPLPPAPAPYLPPPAAQPYPAPYAPQPYSPYPPQPYPPQPYPPQPYPPQPYPPPQPYAPQPLPPLPQQSPLPYAPPPPYGQPAPYGQPLPPPAYGQPIPQAAPPPFTQPPPYYVPPSAPLPPLHDPNKRSDGEMAVLYGTSIAYGIGTGIWIDGLVGGFDPGLDFIAPILIGGAVPVSLYLTDHYYPFHRGVPESISTGLLLGAVEGIAISGTQWQLAGGNSPGNTSWSFAGQATATWILSTAGGVGGYAFGEWLRPDSRSLTFIASGGGWGALAGTELGAAIGSGDWKSGASIAGLIGYNAGLLATGAISTRYMPSWRSQGWMWVGFLAGTAASSLVYLFYIGSSADPRHGLIANSLGGLAGVGLAAALTANMKDDDGTNNAVKHGQWTPPFDVGVRPVTSPIYGSTQTVGASLTASGTW